MTLEELENKIDICLRDYIPYDETGPATKEIMELIRIVYDEQTKQLKMANDSCQLHMHFARIREGLIALEHRETDCDEDRLDLCNWAIDYALQLDAPKTLEERVADLEKKIK